MICEGRLTRAPVARDTRLTAYFLGVISAGRYREISMPAATWHMVGFFQLFFIYSSCCTGPEADPFLSWPLLGTLCNGPSKWTNETERTENGEIKKMSL